MRIAFLILNHRTPPQLLRLLNILRSQLPDSPIVVHHDSSHGELPPALMEPIGNIHLLMRGTPIAWGDFSLVDAYCWSLAWMRENLEFDWVLLLSGQDYPIKPLGGLGDDLSADGSDAILRAIPISQMPVIKRVLMRRRYFFQYKSMVTSVFKWLPKDVRCLLCETTQFAAFVVNNLQPVLKLYKLPGRIPYRIGLRATRTPFSRNWPCWQGSSWFALSWKALEYALDYVEEHPEYVHYCSRTLNPDESMLASVLFNSSSLNVSNRDITYTRWATSRTAHPDTFQIADFNELIGVPQYFARKFDINKYPDILDALDNFIGQDASGINLS